MKSKKIQLKDLKSGMKIKSFDGDSIVYRNVLQVWNTKVETTDRLILQFVNNTKLRCSINHPIMILINNEIHQKLPKDLTEFDEIITENGSTYLYSIEEDKSNINYIDIEVADTNTFYASAEKTTEMVLTHNSQGSIRAGSGTLYYPIWHLEVEDLLVLKNNKGTEDNRIRHMDYGVQFNKVIYERLLVGGNITLFSPHDVPDLYEAFFVDVDKFRELYEKYEKNTKIRKKQIPAIDLFSSFMQERKDTGRIYLMNVDHVNDHGPYIKEVAPIRMSNLCTEITNVSKPLNDINDGTSMKRIRVPKEQYNEFLNYKKTNSNLLFLNKEKFNGSKNTKEKIIENKNWLYEIVDNDQEILDEYIYSFEEVEDVDGPEIALCTLSSINFGKIKKISDFERICTLTVRALDEILDYQYYPVKAAKISTMNRKPIGIGITNLAYWLAKNDLTYQNITQEGLNKLHEYVEAWSFNIIKASVDLAKEKGACPKSSETKYSLGIMPIDTYKKEVDELVEPNYKMDWDSLKEEAKKYGIRNSTLMAQMPNESSSQTNNSTNGIEPPRNLVSIKRSKDGVLKQVVPEISKLRKKYDLLWDQKSPIGYLKICTVLQKFIDQAISVNTSYNPKFYENEEIPMSEMLQHLLFFYRFGGKNLYYCNSNDGAGELEVKLPDLIQAENNIEDNESICESCSI